MFESKSCMSGQYAFMVNPDSREVGISCSMVWWFVCFLKILIIQNGAANVWLAGFPFGLLHGSLFGCTVFGNGNSVSILTLHVHETVL